VEARHSCGGPLAAEVWRGRPRLSELRRPLRLAVSVLGRHARWLSSVAAMLFAPPARAHSYEAPHAALGGQKAASNSQKSWTYEIWTR